MSELYVTLAGAPKLAKEHVGLLVRIHLFRIYDVC